jgi:hypothetical protein
MPGVSYVWEYFTAGQEVPDAGITVLDVIDRGHKQTTTRYRVRMDCCGTEVTITHSQIRKRAKSLERSEDGKAVNTGAVRRCRWCRKRGPSEDSDAFEEGKPSRLCKVPLAVALKGLTSGYHGWAPPPSACRDDGWVWADRGGI